MLALRIIWPIIATLLVSLLIAKFVLAAIAGHPVELLAPAIGVLFCFYLLFMLEGLQVAGLKIKDHDGEAIEQYLATHVGGDRHRVLAVHDTFSNNFDGFVTGRQVFVIMTVVALAFLTKSVVLSWEDVQNSRLAPLATEAGSALKYVVVIVNGTLFAFASSTLIPAWISQLLPQFLADRGAISFIGLPGARLVLSLAMFLDKIQLGYPAKVMLGLMGQSSHLVEHIPIGKSSFYDASVNFYGRAKGCHAISLRLGKPTIIRETISFLFKRGDTERLYHKIQLSAPVRGNIQGRIEMPENVHMQVQARDTNDAGLYTYWLEFHFNQTLPLESSDTDEVVLVFQYTTDAYTDASGISQSTEFSSTLPTETAKISIVGGSQLLKKPKVSILEANQGALAAVPEYDEAGNWIVSTPQPGENRSNIRINYPTVGTVYRIEFETMDVALGLA